MRVKLVLKLNTQLWYVHRKNIIYPQKILAPVSLSNSNEAVSLLNLGNDVVLAVFDYDN